MGEIAEFNGGPWDGARRSVTQPSPLMWLSPNDGTVPLPSVKGKAGEGEPYMLRDVRRESGVRTRRYFYAGHSFVLCPGCGVIHSRRNADGTGVRECGLCGTVLPVHA